MTAPRQVDYSTGIVVSSLWLNRIQEVLAGYNENALPSVSGTSVVITGGTSDKIAALVIGGRMRYVEAPVSVNLTGQSAGTYGIWATTDTNDSVNTFLMAAVLSPTAPATPFFRQVGTAVWNGSAITSFTPLIGVIGTTQVADGSITAAKIAAQEAVTAPTL